MAKTDFLTADMTRRQFMKISGKSLAGLSLSASMLSLFGCSQQQVDTGAVATWALPQGLLVVNADLCTGCQRCEINCTLTNDGVCSSYISRVKIQRRLNLDGAGNGLLSGTDNCWVYFPDTCRQCEDPACGNACPQKAITTNEQGIRVEIFLFPCGRAYFPTKSCSSYPRHLLMLPKQIPSIPAPLRHKKKVKGYEKRREK